MSKSGYDDRLGAKETAVEHLPSEGYRLLNWRRSSFIAVAGIACFLFAGESICFAQAEEAGEAAVEESAAQPGAAATEEGPAEETAATIGATRSNQPFVVEIPPQMRQENALLTEQEEQDLKKVVLTAATLLKIERPTQKQADDIRKIAKYYVYRLSVPKYQSNLPKISQELINQLETVAKGDAREILIAEVIKLAPELFTNHWLVRTNAVLLLGRLRLEPGGTAARPIPGKPHPDAIVPLLKVLGDPQQFVFARTHAARGIAENCRDGNPKAEHRYQGMRMLIDILKQEGNHFWLDVVAADSLGVIGQAMIDQKPEVLEVLAATMSDKSRDWRIRSRAALSIGRLQLPGDTNITLLAVEATRLGSEMAVAYDANPQWGYWKTCFLELYLAFQIESPEDKEQITRQYGLILKTKQGPFKSHADAVTAAYKHSLQMVNAVQQKKPIPDGTTQTVNDWIQKNTPEKKMLNPTLPYPDAAGIAGETAPSNVAAGM